MDELLWIFGNLSYKTHPNAAFKLAAYYIKAYVCVLHFYIYLSDTTFFYKNIVDKNIKA